MRGGLEGIFWGHGKVLHPAKALDDTDGNMCKLHQERLIPCAIMLPPARAGTASVYFIFPLPRGHL